MSSIQAQETPVLRRYKRRNSMICVSATVLLSAAVAATCYFLGANRPSEENNTDSLTGVSISSTPITSTTMLPSQAPFTQQEVGIISDESISRLHWHPSAYPTSSLSWEVDKMTGDKATQLELRSQVPSAGPSFSKEATLSNDEEDYGNIEFTVFEGPVVEFLATKELARISYQNNGCAINEGRWRFQLDTDYYPWETSWALTKGGQTIAFGPPNGRNYARRTRYIGSMCLEAGSYTLLVKDQGGDGLCCKYGEGGFSVELDGESVVESDDSDFRVMGFSFNVIQPYDETCFTESTYDSIDNDIADIKNGIGNDHDRSHFLGGIVRLAAHDFMDFDPHESSTMGSDGCFDPNHEDNNGLETIWCPTCELTLLYEEKYSHISKADFWIASSNAVIRQTSVDNALNLKGTFLWGRKDANSCHGSGDRLPKATGCEETEDVFLERMGLEWRDAVALMGAHTLGRGDFSGHHGTWVDTDKEAQVFDKKYYDELFNSVWWPINMGAPTQDWITGRDFSSRMMLNTDIAWYMTLTISSRHPIFVAQRPTMNALGGNRKSKNARCTHGCIPGLKPERRFKKCLADHTHIIRMYLSTTPSPRHGGRRQLLAKKTYRH